jgi:uncharacterized protein YneF (UPF0154 family)
MSSKQPLRSSMSSKQPKPDFPTDFFRSLHLGDEEDAVACLRSEAIPDGSEPSPRAAALIKTGEWDSNQKMSLVLIENNACTGRIGNDEHRFCGKPYCTVAAHSKNTIGNVSRGWYIASLGRAHGVLSTPSLPPAEDGGPITGAIAGRLLSPDAPFRLSRGQWKFVIDSWHASRVETVSEGDVDEDEAEDQTPTHLARPPPPIETKPAVPAVATPELAQIIQRMQEEYEQRFAGQDEQYRQMQQFVESTTSRNRYVEEQYRRVEARCATMEDHVRLTNRQYERSQEELVALRERFEDLESSTPTGFTRNEIHQVISARLVDKVEQLDTAVFGSNGTIARLKDSFLEFKERIESGGGVECNGIAFKSYRDFMDWYDKESPSVDIFLDGLAYMHAIRAPVVHPDDATKNMEMQLKTQMATGLEASVLTSFATVIPSILVGSGGKSGEGTKGGTYAWLHSYLKSFEVWKPVGTNNGVSHQITSGITSVTKRVTELRRQYSVNPDVVLLSAGLCQDSSQFCNDFVRFINDQQEDLTNNTAYTEEQVWNMQLECIQKIVEELNQAREGFADAGRAARGNYVWGMIMAWKVQQRYMENNFKDDPALTGVLVRRILMQGQDSSVKKKLAKIDALESKLDEHKRKVTSDLAKLKEDIAKQKH